MSDRLSPPRPPKRGKYPRLPRLGLRLRLRLPTMSANRPMVGERPRVILEDDLSDGLQRAVCLDCPWDGNWGDGVEAGVDQDNHEVYGCRRHLFTAALRHNQPRRTQ